MVNMYFFFFLKKSRSTSSDFPPSTILILTHPICILFTFPASLCPNAKADPLPREKITDLSPELKIEHNPASRTTPTTSTSASTMESKSHHLRNTIAKTWPPHATNKEKMSLTIAMDDVYRVYLSIRIQRGFSIKHYNGFRQSNCPPASQITINER